MEDRSQGARRIHELALRCLVCEYETVNRDGSIHERGTAVYEAS